MMFSEGLSSTEEIYYEAGEVLNSYHQESQLRFSENVVYIPHFFSPVMILEYVPVLYNYLIYEPYLMNRFEVVYVPYLRQAYVPYLVPYYLQTQEFFSSSTGNEHDTPYNSYPEIRLDDVISDDLDEINSSTSLSDVTSVISLPRSYSSNSSEHTQFSNSTQESCESVQEFVCTEFNDNLYSACHDEHKSAQEYPEPYFSEATADVGIEAHASNLSLVFVDDEKEPNELDYPEDYLHPVSFHEDQQLESDVSNPCVLTDAEKSGGLTNPVKVEESSTKDLGKDRNISPETSENHAVIYNENGQNELDYAGDYLHPVSFHEDQHVETDVSNPSLLTDAEKSGGLTDPVKVEASSTKDIEKDRNISPETSENHAVIYNENGQNELDYAGDYLHPVSFHEDQHVETDVSNPPLLSDAEKSGGLTDSVKVEASSLKVIEKDRYISPERRVNHTIFDSDMESRVSSASSVGHAERCQDEIGFEHSQLFSVKNKNVKTSDSHSSPQMPVWSQETPLQNPSSMPKIDASVPDPFDDANSEKGNDSDGEPTISLQDILASEEYWRLKRDEYFDKRRNTQLYRSALERDIHPRRSLPEVGTLATIFEDLPHPINEPYDDGVQEDQGPVKDDYFDLQPLEVERSKSSHTTLLPKKKRFRNTKKFFSGLFRCFKPR